MDNISTILGVEKILRELETRMILVDDPSLREIYRCEMEAVMDTYPRDTILQAQCWKRFKTMGNYIRLQNGHYYLRFPACTFKTAAWKDLVRDIISSWECLRVYGISWKLIDKWLTYCMGAYNIHVDLVQAKGGRIIVYKCSFGMIA